MDNNNGENPSTPPDQLVRGTYDVIVVGAGHAGCEAALACARMGCKTLLLTMNLDSIALMPCNPSMGGPAKGHLIKEIDALGGEIGRNTDRTVINGRLVVAAKTQRGGRAGEGPALGISDSLRALGLEIRRFKTGTPPRIDARTIDFSKTEPQPGSRVPLYFSHDTTARED